ncbi:2'-5' RNA ligase family protein [Flavobacterium sp. H122]|uniref:2'-5' RNA ligase family protein n=1 Tax=Flavobacterium sp. H122 TaxID=2529860 RepID=UPI0010AB3A46|nr:2'-5' RNA ligase family protein [Flavobacterium sp. H122]
MLNRYSVVINPSPKIIDEVKLMKELLAGKIGWYNSKNSLAHITINEFEAPASELVNIKKHLQNITRHLKAEEVLFNKLDTFPNGAFFLGAEEKSKLYLKETMQNIHQSFVYKTAIKSTEPHISIGRRITPENIKIAYALFTTPSLSFLCDRIALRVFNTNRKQFDIVEEFIFQGREKEGEQGVLF